MPVLFEQIEADIVIFTYDGQIIVEDALEPLQQIALLSQTLDPNDLHVIYDVRTLTMSFADFMSYISKASERRRDGHIPTNMKQYVVGTNHWMRSIRDWLDKQYDTRMGLFTDLESAIEFIHEKRQSA